MRANELGLSLSEVCRQANISRQTLYSLELVPHRLPALQTVVALASVLAIHPQRLLQLVFDDLPIKQQLRLGHTRRDESAFVQESIPDGTLVFFHQRFTKTWELQNVGCVPWENRFLQCMDEQVVVVVRARERERERSIRNCPKADTRCYTHCRSPHRTGADCQVKR